MAFAKLPSGLFVPVGSSQLAALTGPATLGGFTLDAVNEALIFIGQIFTEDGGTHTIDTSGSSSLGWLNAATTLFASGSTTIKAGLAAVDAANGPPGRAVNVSNVITFDVSASYTGGTGSITNAWIETAPNAGSKTIANGDLVAFAVQMTARGGTDQINPATSLTSTGAGRPFTTHYAGGTYTLQAAATPNCTITFSDGKRGYFVGVDVAASAQLRTWNNGSATKEYGQLFQMPFGMQVCGMYAQVDPDGDFDLVLYSDPLGTPVAERTASFDLNAQPVGSSRRTYGIFSTPYDVKPNQPIGMVIKPTSVTSITTSYKTLSNAAYRTSDPWGLTGYGINRASGAFANQNSSLDHHYVGMLLSGFAHPARPTLALGF